MGCSLEFGKSNQKQNGSKIKIQYHIGWFAENQRLFLSISYRFLATTLIISEGFPIWKISTQEVGFLLRALPTHFFISILVVALQIGS